MRGLAISFGLLSFVACASIPRSFELSEGTTVVLSLTGEGMIVTESPYVFVLYSDGHAIYRRWERGTKRLVPRYYTAAPSAAELQRLKRTVEPEAIAALLPIYNLAPRVSDLGDHTLSIGPPWLRARHSVAVRGLLPWTGPPEMDFPPPPAFSRAYEALVDARFSNETPWEPREFFIDVVPSKPQVEDFLPRREQPAASCMLPSAWTLREVEHSPSVGATRWALDGSHLRQFQELREGCSGRISMRSGEVRVSYQLRLPHEQERLPSSPRP